MMVGAISILFSTSNSSTTVVLKRHLAPRTVGLIERLLFQKSIRVRAVVRSNKEEVGFPLRIGRVGLEKPISDLNPGEITYWPQGSTLSVQFVKRSTRFRVNRLGTLENDQINFFHTLRIGTGVTLSLVASDELDSMEEPI